MGSEKEERKCKSNSSTNRNSSVNRSKRTPDNVRPRTGMSDKSCEERQVVTPPLNLTLFGSPAPRCYHRPSSLKPRQPTQPPNSPTDTIKLRKPPPLPIDNIILLTKKLQLDDAGNIPDDTTPRQIKIANHEDAFEPALKLWQEDAHLSSSTIDLSIDISSVTNSCRESDASSDEFEPEFHVASTSGQCRLEYTESSSSCWSRSPVHNDLRTAVAKSPHTGASGSTTSYPWSHRNNSSRFEEEENDSFNERHSKDFGTEALFCSDPGCERYRRSRSADLIYLYVNTVSNKQKLSKYFRTCSVCKEPSCVCLEADTTRTFYMEEEKCRCQQEKTLEACRRQSAPEKFHYHDSATYYQPKEPQRVSESGSDSPCSEFSLFLKERRKKIHSDRDALVDSGTSTLQLDDVDSVTSLPAKQPSSYSGPQRKQVSMSVLQLATAAQCARILADSLESVLSVIEESTHAVPEDQLVLLEDMNGDQLFKTLDILRANETSQRRQDGWACFDNSGQETMDQQLCFDDDFCNSGH